MGSSTSSFGVSGRESHDSSAFYARFESNEQQSLSPIGPIGLESSLFVGDSRHMREIPDNSISLVVTSPPYNAGKDYESTVVSFDDYLDLLVDAFRECYRVLQPGGRIAINVANLGRKPYVPLTMYVDAICHDIGFLPRGQIIWVKGKGASGSCAWGTFQSAKNPVFRDLHEYVMVYCKESFGLVSKGESTITKEEFLEYTLSVWNVSPVSAKRIGHPAPFPVEIPRRLIKLFTYRGDYVLDPFMGSGSTAIAALDTDRKYIGYDLEESYIGVAETRVAQWKDERGIL